MHAKSCFTVRHTEREVQLMTRSKSGACNCDCKNRDLLVCL